MGTPEQTPLLRSTARRALFILLALIVLGTLVRCRQIGDPVFSWRVWRQYDTAAIARNFAEESLNILYPQVDWRGLSPGYVEAEFQVYTFAVALLYRLFGVHEWLGLAFNIGIYILAAIVLFRLARRLFDVDIGLASVFFYSFVPLSIFGMRSFQPDAMMSLGCIAAVYYFWIWTEEGKRGAWVLSALGMCLAVLIKPLALYFGLPLLYLAWRKFGWRLFRMSLMWLYAGVVFLPSVLWFRHAYQLWIKYGNTFGVFGGQVKTGPWELFNSSWITLAYRMSTRLLFEILTIPGLALLVLAVLFYKLPRGRNGVLYWWLAGFAISVILAPAGYLGHDYYELPLVFVTSIFMGYAAMTLWRRDGNWRAVVLACCLLSLGLNARRIQQMMGIDKPTASRYEFDQRIRQVTDPDALIVFVRPRFYPFHPEYYQHRTAQGEFFYCDPVDFYLSHRKGWSLDEVQASSGLLEVLRRRGARYFATTFPEVLSRHGLKDLLDRYYTPVEVTPQGVLYALQPSPGSSSLGGVN